MALAFGAERLQVGAVRSLKLVEYCELPSGHDQSRHLSFVLSRSPWAGFSQKVPSHTLLRGLPRASKAD